MNPVKDIIKFVVIFGIVYALWRLFWHSVFAAWDLFGLVGVTLLLGLLYHACRKFLGARGKEGAIQRPVGTIPLLTSVPPPNMSSSLPLPTDVFSLPLSEDYVTLVGRVQLLEFRCGNVWQTGLEQRRNYRKLRREGIAAARYLAEIEQEAAVPDEALSGDIDAFMDGLCAVYLGADSQLRLEIRALLESNTRLLGNVYNYSGRAAGQLKNTGKPLFLLRGLLAASIDNNGSHQDWEWILGELWLAASQQCVDPEP